MQDRTLSPTPDPRDAAAPSDQPPTATREFFANDRFAGEQCGVQIIEAEKGRAVCAFDIAPHHRNALGAVMGGAIFTLADFAVAVASNIGQAPCVTASSSIEFIASAKGTRLTATCTADRTGRRLGFYTTRIEDDRGVLVALVQTTCLRA